MKDIQVHRAICSKAIRSDGASMTAVELTPETLKHLARLADLSDVNELELRGDHTSAVFEVWLAIAVDELEAQRDRELRRLAEARLLLDKVGVHLSTKGSPVPSMEADPSGVELLEAARRVGADRARLEVLELLARTVERFATKGSPPRVRVDLFSKGALLSTVWLDEPPRSGEVLDLDVDGVPRCRVVTPLVHRGPGHVEVHVVPFKDGGEF